MKTILRFNRQVLAVIRDEIERAIEPVKKNYGLEELSIESVSFSEFTFQVKLCGKVAGSDARELQIPNHSPMQA